MPQYEFCSVFDTLTIAELHTYTLTGMTNRILYEQEPPGGRPAARLIAQLGQAGWQLVSVVKVPATGTTFYFQRPIE